MAFFNDLVRVIAVSEGMDEMTVRGIGLSVRDAGYISKGGRGLSAAKMTFADAANLLIGVNASRTAKESGSIVGDYRRLILTDRLGLQKGGSGEVFERANLREEFGGFLEMLISIAGDGDRLGYAIASAIDFPQGGIAKQELASSIDQRIRLEIAFSKPEPEVKVQFIGIENGFKYGQLWYSGAWDGNASDRADVTSISQATLRAVAKLIVE